MAKFRRGELNLLIATHVGAEGLDFGCCGLVVLLDPPGHVVDYLQCRWWTICSAGGGLFAVQVVDYLQCTWWTICSAGAGVPVRCCRYGHFSVLSHSWQLLQCCPAPVGAAAAAAAAAARGCSC